MNDDLNRTPVVEMRGITKTFGSTRALRGVDLTVHAGEVHALLGRNGAGKSTLVSALSGYTPSDSGTIRIGDVTVTSDGQDYAAEIRAEIAHVQQTPQLFDHLTVAENLFVENEQVRNRWGFVDQKRVLSRAGDLLTEWKMHIPPEMQAGALDAESRQLLEIMKALSRGVPVIILDEPTAALSNAEKRILFRHVKELKARGIAFVYISHHLEEVFDVADVVTVLRDGEIVRAREPVGNLDVNMIANLMVGEDVSRSSRVDYTREAASPLLRAEGVRTSKLYADTVDLEVRAGEILALAGPVGSGKEDLAMVLAGQLEPVAGKVTGPNGKLPTVGLVPTDRHISGYVGLLSVRENISLGGLDLLSNRFGFISKNAEAKLVQRLTDETHVKASSNEQPVGQLSGGNQQKVVFARALCHNPEVIVAMSPTRGVDVGAKEQLYALLRNLADEGIAVVVVSDEHEEIDQLANRVAFVYEHRLVGELAGDYHLKDLILRMEGVA
jgi:ABC-type sugar transport system ATPase subunit